MSADLKPHEQRVVAELDELRGRLNKLEAFIDSEQFVTLPLEDRELLILQKHLMSSLGFVLARRIARFHLNCPLTEAVALIRLAADASDDEELSELHRRADAFLAGIAPTQGGEK